LIWIKTPICEVDLIFQKKFCIAKLHNKAKYIFGTHCRYLTRKWSSQKRHLCDSHKFSINRKIMWQLSSSKIFSLQNTDIQLSHFDNTVRDPKVSHFFQIKNFGEVWHFGKIYPKGTIFAPIIKQNKNALGCGTLGSWTIRAIMWQLSISPWNIPVR